MRCFFQTNHNKKRVNTKEAAVMRSVGEVRLGYFRAERIQCFYNDTILINPTFAFFALEILLRKAEHL